MISLAGQEVGVSAGFRARKLFHSWFRSTAVGRASNYWHVLASLVETGSGAAAVGARGASTCAERCQPRSSLVSV